MVFSQRRDLLSTKQAYRQAVGACNWPKAHGILSHFCWNSPKTYTLQVFGRDWKGSGNGHQRQITASDYQNFESHYLEFYKQNPQWILPESRMKFVTTAVEEGLEDLSISRPSSRLTWGIPVPDDSSQTIYVWLDALLNYAVQAGFPWSPDMPTAGGWPADVHVIGKDILRYG